MINSRFKKSRVQNQTIRFLVNFPIADGIQCERARPSC